MITIDDDFFGPEEGFQSRTATREHRQGRGRNMIFLAVGIAAVVGVVTGGFFLLTSGGGPKAPGVEGMKYGEAKKKIENAGLGVEIDPKQDSEGVEGLDGHKVEWQDPKPGTGVEKDEVVTLGLKGLSESVEATEDSKNGKREPGPATELKTTQPSSAPDATQPPQAVAPTGGGKVVCLDPGHSANSPANEMDPGGSGLDVADNSGASGELAAMWELSQKTKARLEQMGYTVRPTKESANSYASLRTRADIGNACSIIVRLHYDPAMQAILYPGEGQYKQHGGTVVRVDPNVSRASAALASAMAPFLQGVGIGKVANDMGGTSNNTGPAYVGSVLSRVPVVLIENNPSTVRGNPGGQDQVADAIAQGINTYFQSR